ncbi:MAG: hypothetical protein ACRDQ2_17800 [Gaiellales bacterium]
MCQDIREKGNGPAQLAAPLRREGSFARTAPVMHDQRVVTRPSDIELDHGYSSLGSAVDAGEDVSVSDHGTPRMRDDHRSREPRE